MWPGPFRVLTVLALLAALVAAAPAAACDMEGFRGIRWGDPVEALGPAQKARLQMSRTEFYRRTGDSLRLGGADLDSLLYGFWEGRLAWVLLSCKGADNVQALQQVMMARCGQGRVRNLSTVRQELVWQGKEVQINLDINRVLNRAVLSIMSRRMIAEQVVKGLEEALEGARRDF